MKKMLAILTSGALALGSALAAPIVGQKVPNFTGVASNGETVSLDQFAGKRVVLEWTNHECPFVRKHYNSGNMQSTQKKTIADGTVWISIISSAEGEQGYVTADVANNLTETRNAAPTMVVLDESGDIGQLFKAKTTPHMFVIDEEQILQYAGAIDSIPSANAADIAQSTNYVNEAVASLRNGEAIVTRQTQPYGCSVKYAS